MFVERLLLALDFQLAVRGVLVVEVDFQVDDHIDLVASVVLLDLLGVIVLLVGLLS